MIFCRKDAKDAEKNISNNDRCAWTGPALFTAVLIGVVVFFWWFLSK